MYCLSRFCRLCMNNVGTLISLSTSDVDMITFYHKLKMCFPEINYDTERNKSMYICESCCENLNRTYAFKNVCFKTDAIYKGYVLQLSNSHLKQNKELMVVLNKNTVVNYYTENPTKSDPNMFESVTIKVEYTEDTSYNEESTETECYKSGAAEEYHSISHDLADMVEIKMDIVEWNRDDYCASLNREVPKQEHSNSELELSFKDNVRRMYKNALVNGEINKHVQMEEKSTNTEKLSAGKRFVCGICDKSFNRRSHMKGHARIHTGEKPFACDICGKRFNQTSNLFIHKRIHTGEKPFACNTCDKRFSRGTELERHRRIHTGEKPYGCDMCTKSFNQKSQMICHKRIHTGEKPFACDICGQRFTQKALVERHKKNHTGENTSAKNIN